MSADVTMGSPSDPDASISTRILGPDPTASEAYRVHPIVDPTKFWGKCWRRPYTAMETPAY